MGAGLHYSLVSYAGEETPSGSADHLQQDEELMESPPSFVLLRRIVVNSVGVFLRSFMMFWEEGSWWNAAQNLGNKRKGSRALKHC